MRVPIRLVALGSVAACLLLAAPAAVAAPGFGPAVYGAGSGPLDADRVHVIVVTRGSGVAATGQITIVHQTPTGIFAYLSVRVDCARIAGHAAVVTGTITGGFDGLGVDPVGHRVSVAVRDATPDTVDLDVSFASGHEIGPCTSEPVLPLVITAGDFRVV